VASGHFGDSNSRQSLALATKNDSKKSSTN